MLKIISDKNIVKYITVAIILIVAFILVDKRMSYLDVYYNEITEPGYVYGSEENKDGIKLVAEGMNLNYIYAGKYIVTISHSPAQDGDYCEIVDNKTGDILGANVLSTDSNSTAVLVNVKDRAESISAKLYSHAKLDIVGYIIQSDGKVYTDTHWARRILLVYVIAVAYGYWVYRKKGGRFLQLLLFATACSIPLWTQTIPIGHDVAFNYTRYHGIVEGLRLHEFPVRINGAFYHGAGYLVDLMYPGLIQYPFAFMSAHGASTLFSFKIMLIASVFATVFCAYYPMRKILGDKTALIFMFVYTLNPFRLNELYVRCALGEYLAMIFLPLVFAGIYQLVIGDYKIGFYEAFIGITLVFVSHLLSILFVVGFSVLAYVLLLFFTKFEVVKNLKRDATIILCAISTVAVNMWFWRPMLDYYNPKYCIASFHGTISRSVIYLFGAFMDGYTDPQKNKALMGIETNGGVTYSVGMIVFVCLCIYLYIRVFKKEEITNRNIMDFALLLGLLALFIESEFFPWKYLEDNGSIVADAFGKLQFIWRFQMVVALMLGIVAAGTLEYLLKNRKQAFWTLFFILVINAAWLSREYIFGNNLYQIGKFNVPASMMNGDYLESDIDYTNVGLYLESGEEPLTNDDIVISNTRRDGLNYSFEFVNESGSEAHVIIPVIYSGFYEVLLNGENVQKMKNAETSLIELAIDRSIDQAKVDVIYREPSPYRLYEVISLLTFLLVAISFAWAYAGNVRKAWDNYKSN